MAKGIARCKCKICGKMFEKEFVEYGKGSSSRVDAKVEWAESGGIDTCPECYKAAKSNEDTKKGLTCEVTYEAVKGNYHVVFTGDTYPHRVELKEAGCKWTDDYITKSGCGNVKAWVYYAATIEEAAKITALFGVTVDMPKPRKATHKTETTTKTKRAKKLTADQAVLAITTQVRNIKDLRDVLDNCTVEALREIAKATAHKMGVKVSYKLRRSELLDLLNQHINWVFREFEGRKELGECVNQYRSIKELKAAKTAEQWRNVWHDKIDGQYNSVKERALMACKKQMLMQCLSVKGSKRMTKQQIIDKYYEAKKAA